MKSALSRSVNSNPTFYSVAILLICVLFSCKKDSEKIYQQNKQDAKYRFVNAVQTASNVDLYLDNVKINSVALPFGESIEYVKLSSGSKKATILSEETEQANASVNFVPTFSYTSFYVANKDQTTTLITFEDNLGAIEAGKAKIRFVNTSPFFSNAINATLTGGNLLVNALQFKEVSGYFSIDPSVNIRVNIVGSGISKTIPTAEIEAGKSYTFWVSGSSNANLTVNKIIYN